jgi:hypothetical protein
MGSYGNNYRSDSRNYDRYDDRRNDRRNDGGQQKKKSGATYGQGKNGKPYVQGWKASKRSGLNSFFAFPYEGTHETTAANSGQKWQNWMLKITNKETYSEQLIPCLYQVSTHRIFCEKLDLMLSPKAKNGGYAGSFLKKH